MDIKIITIGREFGSGGRLIGRRLAEALGIPFYDRELIELTTEKSGFTREMIEMNEQVKTSSLLYSLYSSTRELPVSDQIFIVQTKIIREISGQGPCVIVGRCADYVLRENPACLRTFIHAPVETRIHRITTEYGLRDDNPEALLRKEDKKRAAYYNHFTQGKWGAHKQYHLSVDSSLGIDTAVRVIREAATGGTL